MSADYDVFICHRGVDTKRNLVSVLSGMLRSRGITCLIDYKMNEGAEIMSAIVDAIKSPRVHIVIFSPNFETSKWCLNELAIIMDLQNSAGTSDRSRIVIPIFCNVERAEVLQRAKDSEYNLKTSSAEERQRWSEAIERLCGLASFDYDSKTMLQWEELSKVVTEAEIFLKEVSSRSILPHQGQEHQRRSTASDYDVFVCHLGRDTKLNVVSVLRGMLPSQDLTCFVHDEMEDEAEMKPHIVEAIRKSKAYVILLSPDFGTSKRCLEEVLQIMNRRSALGTSSIIPPVLPIFYDVAPAIVRDQRSEYDLRKVAGSTAEERGRWFEALEKLSFIKDFELHSRTMFQWEELERVVKEVRMSLEESTPRNPYAE
ncbi:hypothetical protein KP509_08G008200 [Ceratopteris richardii]|uniref:ADP-ribosyl cyclase/cyclic ADP-ribose hydrolase n=1 Tax=Ceratopteris richardii TaxID=49495 RepID=A0A8T2UA66_CERRI|nr:hypothetical protein KP509_08G008200 [Ceratopteris richardii]